jgi:hypothetical protein
VSSAINSYYTAALSPAVAALTGTGLALAWQYRHQARTWMALCVALLATTGYALWLLPASGTGLPPWLEPALAGLAVAAACCLAALTWRPLRQIVTPVSITLSVLAILIVPATAAASVVSSGLGPFETPFEPQTVTTDATAFFGAGFQVAQVVPALEAGNRGIPDLMATQTSALAAPFIWATGQEVIPIGGFTGTIPEPTLAALQSMIQMNDARTFIQSPTTTDPRLAWIARHCIKITKTSGPAPVLPISTYYCLGFSSP